MDFVEAVKERKEEAENTTNGKKPVKKPRRKKEIIKISPALFTPRERRSSNRIKGVKRTYDECFPEEDECFPEEDESFPEEAYKENRGSRRKTRTRAVTISPPALPVEQVTNDLIEKIHTKSVKKLYSKDGTTCHQCRQKTMDQKTYCRSGRCVGLRGQFCGTCLLNRYGEDAADALKDPSWSCPVCRGICNCSFCRLKSGEPATGILAPLAQKLGYKSAKHYLDNEKLYARKVMLGFSEEGTHYSDGSVYAFKECNLCTHMSHKHDCIIPKVFLVEIAAIFQKSLNGLINKQVHVENESVAIGMALPVPLDSDDSDEELDKTEVKNTKSSQKVEVLPQPEMAIEESSQRNEVLPQPEMNIEESSQRDEVLPQPEMNIEESSQRVELLPKTDVTIKESSQRDEVLPQPEMNIEESSQRNGVLPQSEMPIEESSQRGELLPKTDVIIKESSQRDEVLPQPEMNIEESSQRNGVLPQSEMPIEESSQRGELLPKTDMIIKESSQEVLPQPEMNIEESSQRDEVFPSTASGNENRQPLPLEIGPDVIDFDYDYDDLLLHLGFDEDGNPVLE